MRGRVRVRVHVRGRRHEYSMESPKAAETQRHQHHNKARGGIWGYELDTHTKFAMDDKLPVGREEVLQVLLKLSHFLLGGGHTADRG